MNCILKGVRKNGSVAFETPYPSRGWAYASATGAVIGLAHSSNPDLIDHLEIWELGKNGLPDTRLWTDDSALEVRPERF